MNISSFSSCRRAGIVGAISFTLWPARPDAAAGRSSAERIRSRDYPSVFQAWNPIDMPDRVPLATLDDRLKAAAKHDLIWDEQVSQLG